PLASSSSYSFCSCARRPPSSSLFPYTTLFRSLPVAAPVHRHPQGHRRPQLRAGGGQLRGERPGPHRAGLEAGGRTRRQRLDLEGDRKSTRLNSSHCPIPHPVFCLKKKNDTHIS